MIFTTYEFLNYLGAIRYFKSNKKIYLSYDFLIMFKLFEVINFISTLLEYFRNMLKI